MQYCNVRPTNTMEFFLTGTYNARLVERRVTVIFLVACKQSRQARVHSLQKKKKTATQTTEG